MVILLAVLGGRALGRRLLVRIAAIARELTGINERDRHDQLGLGHDPAQISQLVRCVNKTLDMLDRERQYASNVSHEMRSPITGLRTELEEARLHPEQLDATALVDHALDGVERLEAIVSDLLFMAQMNDAESPGGHEVLDLGEFVRHEVRRRSDRHPIDLCLTRGVMVDVVRSEMCRALANLLDNAQRYADSVVDVEVYRTHGKAELAVCDDGHGIAKVDRERIFERFVRLRTAPERDLEGTGLGLALVKDVALAHRGSIRVEESSTGGACFVLQLPLAAGVSR
ncbi:sensor histidine kinase [Sphaerisporangium fuscum]|uniref:sensor histidine kinase n=1 Tax=Sphaerisporangium fuscum TaxID=2835868 RepID=UPI001BDCBCF4|nr:HAMP domain-containing sensor histidine kinase [Sphaerisporangium fuscum]